MRRAIVAFVCAAAVLSSATSVYASPPEDTFIPVGDAENADMVDEVVDEFIEDEASEADRLATEYLYAIGFHPETNELRGISESLYQGKWYVPRHDQRRKCIAKRESKANYGAVSSGGLYRGAYQMSQALAVGATWMMQPEVRREMGEEGLAMLRELRETPKNKWNRYWQDRAFWTIWAKGKGQRHWSGGARSC